MATPLATLIGTSVTPQNIVGSTAVGRSVLTVPSPSAIRFLRINADNTVSLLSDEDFRTAIGAGSGGGGGAPSWTQLTGTATVSAGSRSVVTVTVPTNIDIAPVFDAGLDAAVANSRDSVADVVVRVGATRRFRPLTNDTDIVLAPGETIYFCAANTTVFDIL